MRIFGKSILTLAVMCLALAIICPAPAYAGGEKADAAGISMARTFVASARGLEAVGTNPANLTFPYKGKINEYSTRSVTHDSTVTSKDSSGNESTQTISVTHDTSVSVRRTPPWVTFTILPSFGMNIRTDFVNYDIYNKYFTGVDTGGPKKIGRYLSDADKNDVLSIFPSGLAETHTDIDVRLFGMTIHNDWLGDIGLTVTDRAAMNFDLPKDYLRLFLFGLDSAGSSYDMSGTNVRAWYLREFAFSYAHRLPSVTFIKDFSAGFSVKVIQGYAVVTTDKYNATFASTPVRDSLGNIVNYVLDGNFDFRVLRAESDMFTHSSSFTPFPKPAGRGIGIDVGVNGELFRGFQVGASINDIGSVNWTENTKQIVATSTIHMTNPTASDQADSLKNSFKGNDTVAGAFSTALPTCLRIGAAVQVDDLPFISWFPGSMLLSFEYQQGFNTSPGNSTRPRFALGAEYRLLPFLPLRTGLSFGGIDRFNWAGGFGLDFGAFALNAGSENIGLVLTPHSYQQLSFGVSMLFRI